MTKSAPIASRIAERRKELGLTFMQLANITGISRSALQRYEANGYQELQLSKLEKIAEALNVTPMYLMGWEAKNLSSRYFAAIEPPLKKLSYEIKYDSDKDSYYIINKDKQHIYISNDELKSLVDESLSFIEFRISQIISKQSKSTP